MTGKVHVETSGPFRLLTKAEMDYIRDMPPLFTEHARRFSARIVEGDGHPAMGMLSALTKRLRSGYWRRYVRRSRHVRHTRRARR